MYHVRSNYRYDSSSFDTYDEAEKYARVLSLSGYEKIISQDVAHVLPDTKTSTVVVKL